MAASLVLLHHLVLRPLPSSSLLVIKPLCIKTTLHLQKPVCTFFNPPHSSPPPPRPRFFCISSSSSSSLTFPQSPAPPHLLINEHNESDFDSEDEFDKKEEQMEPQNKQEPEPEPEPESPAKVSSSNNSAVQLPSLSVKEKKELAAYAHSLGKKLKSQQVGKSGVTSSVAASFVENLESNELLKLKIHNSCPGELADVVKQLEELTGSVAVGQIGRTVILYRPSLTKLKAEEKKKQAQKKFIRRGLTLKPSDPMQNRGQVLRLSGRGRRGSSRV